MDIKVILIIKINIIGILLYTLNALRYSYTYSKI